MGSKTGGNTEPMPFVRKWGAAAAAAANSSEDGAVMNGPPPPPSEGASLFVKLLVAKTHIFTGHAVSMFQLQHPIMTHLPIHIVIAAVHVIAENVGNADDGHDLETAIATEDIAAAPEDAAGLETESDQGAEARIVRVIVHEIALAGTDSLPGHENALADTGRKRERKSRWSVTKSFVPDLILCGILVNHVFEFINVFEKAEVGLYSTSTNAAIRFNLELFSTPKIYLGGQKEIKDGFP
ncbi:unnamed protein product [Strongylus vulgaris]|uniref:Uncharacterized protein n=1 Tax=Strongylus vulgaris TaxID=40348 RepID=A0A3P7I058_STRVU|nr:unnamed protein product [Strongylus vulgaris]